MAETIVPVLGVLIIFGAPIAAWIVHRVLAHQERLEMIRNGWMPGTVPPPGVTPPGGFPRGGYSGPIPPPTPGMAPFGFDPQAAAQMQLRKGIQVALIGFALVIGLSFIRGPLHPGPWLLGGLIPMFVGVAQIINAMLNGARLPSGPATGNGSRFGPAPGQQPQPGPGPYAAGPTPPPPTPGSYNAWRPDGTPEIPKPASPPDHR